MPHRRTIQSANASGMLTKTWETEGAFQAWKYGVRRLEKELCVCPDLANALLDTNTEGRTWKLHTTVHQVDNDRRQQIRFRHGHFRADEWAEANRATQPHCEWTSACTGRTEVQHWAFPSSSVLIYSFCCSSNFTILKFQNTKHSSINSCSVHLFPLQAIMTLLLSAAFYSHCRWTFIPQYREVRWTQPLATPSCCNFHCFIRMEIMGVKVRVVAWLEKERQNW